MNNLESLQSILSSLNSVNPKSNLSKMLDDYEYILKEEFEVHKSSELQGCLSEIWRLRSDVKSNNLSSAISGLKSDLPAAIRELKKFYP